MLELFVLPLVIVALICVPFVVMAKKIKNGKSPKGAFVANLCSFFGVMGLAYGIFDLTSAGISIAIVMAFILTLIFKPKH